MRATDDADGRGPRSGGRLVAAILAIFVLSGAAGLIYEVVWARQLVLVFGNTTQAVSAILTGYFGGLAIGSVIGGGIADRARSPLRMYAVIEVVLVGVVLVTPLSFRLIHELYRGAYAGLEASPGTLALVRFGLAILALAPATILMGATLPALTRYLTRGRAHLSGAFGRLYAANTIGAILGTLAAGLVLIELLGLGGALLVGAICSATAGVVAFGLARRADAPEPTHGRPEPDAPEPPALMLETAAPVLEPPTVPEPSVEPGPGAARPIARPTLALGVAFVSGLTSLGYQVLWTRLLASGSGSTTYVFTLILATFLAGLAIGAIAFNVIRPRIRNPIALLAATQLAVAVIVIGGLTLFVARPPLLNPILPLEAIGGLWQSVLVVVLPATIVLGIAFPASSALLPPGAEGSGGRAGRLLAANTVGSIAGSFAIPFFIVPWLGSPAAVVLLAGLNVAMAIVLVTTASMARPARLRAAVAVVAVVALLGVAGARPGAGVDPSIGRIERLTGVLYEATEDEIAAVQAGSLDGHPRLWVAGTSMTALTIDANLMPILPLIARPDAERALVVAFGMGSTFRSALAAGLQVDAVELVPSVPRMFGWFHDDAAAVLANPGGRIIVADGRNHLELTDDTFDIIVTDPPPPIESSGASVISSLEYYEAGRAKLNPGGIMMQWVPYGPSSRDVVTHIRTFARVFPEVMVVRGPAGYGAYLMGSDEPFTLDEAAIREVLGRPGVVANLAEPADSPADTVDTWVALIPELVQLEPGEVARAVGDGPLVTDDRPWSEYFLLRRLDGG